MRWKSHVRFGGGPGKRISREIETAPRFDFTHDRLQSDDCLTLIAVIAHQNTATGFTAQPVARSALNGATLKRKSH
jgi:hypothetical protein